jgi:hypothetical protein
VTVLFVPFVPFVPFVLLGLLGLLVSVEAAEEKEKGGSRNGEVESLGELDSLGEFPPGGVDSSRRDLRGLVAIGWVLPTP